MDAVRLLDKILSLKEKDQIQEYNEAEVGPSMYFSLGLWIKDNWIMDYTSPLGQYILDKNPTDLDKYIFMIITIYHRYLNGKPLKIEAELQKIEHENHV